MDGRKLNNLFDTLLVRKRVLKKNINITEHTSYNCTFANKIITSRLFAENTPIPMRNFTVDFCLVAFNVDCLSLGCFQTNVAFGC